VHLLLVSQMLSGGQSKSWGDDTLDGWVVGVVHEQHDSVHGSIHLEISLEESSSFQVNTHSGENNGEILIRVIKDIFTLDKTCLSTDLGTDFIMWKTGSREEWDLLSSSNGGHGIDGRDTSLDHLLWVDSLERINWLTLLYSMRTNKVS